jgi:hypothetical protein
MNGYPAAADSRPRCRRGHGLICTNADAHTGIYGTDGTPPAGPQAQGWTGKCKSTHCDCRVEVGGSSSRHRPGQVLADLAPRAKVVQTVGCSTFTRGAKPATRRVADGERMNPQGKRGAYAPIQGDDEHQGDEHLEQGCKNVCLEVRPDEPARR